MLWAIACMIGKENGGREGNLRTSRCPDSGSGRARVHPQQLSSFHDRAEVNVEAFADRIFAPSRLFRSLQHTSTTETYPSLPPLAQVNVVALHGTLSLFKSLSISTLRRQVARCLLCTRETFVVWAEASHLRWAKSCRELGEVLRMLVGALDEEGVGGIELTR